MSDQTPDYERLYERVVPSVVSVYTGDDGPRRVRLRLRRRTRRDDHHVVRDERTVRVRFADGRWRRGTVVGTDSYTDLAVVAVTDLPADARVVPGLVADGIYRHSYLRARTPDVTPAVAEANGLDEPRDVLVVDVGDPTSGPAGAGERGTETAALRGCTGHRRVRGRRIPTGGDVVVAVDGRPVPAHEELMRHLIVTTHPGETVDVTVLRDGEPDERTIPVRLSECPATEDTIPVR